MQEKRTINITMTEPQSRFLGLKCKYPLFVGGYGSGKTQALCNAALIDASLGGSKSLIGLYAPTYDLVDLIIATRMKEILEEFGIRFVHNKKENTIKTREAHFGNFVLRSCDNPDRIVGYETYRAHIDEIDTLSQKNATKVWDKIISRNRQKPLTASDGFNRVSAYTTPEGFNFVHERWITKGGNHYDYVQADSRSNPYLPDGYIDSLLETYSDELAIAYIEGKFVNLNSGTVYKSYDRNAHRSFEKIKEKEVLYIGCDFNVTKMAASVYVRREGGKKWHAVDEFVDMYDTPDMVATIKEKYSDHQIIMYPDASGANRSTKDANRSDLDLLRGAGFEVRAKKTNPSVKDRVNATNEAFRKGLLYVNDRACPTIASCFEQQAYDKNGQPDKSSGKDHQNDASTYPIAYELPISRPVTNFNFGVIGR